MWNDDERERAAARLAWMPGTVKNIGLATANIDSHNLGWYTTNISGLDMGDGDITQASQDYLQGRMDVRDPYKKELVKEREDMVGVYKVIVVDTKELIILYEGTVIARDEESAVLSIDFGVDRQKITQGMIKTLVTSMGQFKEYAPKVKIVETE
jgi:hypothetical protein